MNLNKQFKTGLAIVIWIIPFMIANKAQDNKDPLPLPEVITSGSGMSAPSDAIILFTEGSTLISLKAQKADQLYGKLRDHILPLNQALGIFRPRHFSVVVSYTLNGEHLLKTLIKKVRKSVIQAYT